MRMLLELLRIIFIFGILGALGWAIIENIYTINEITETYSWLGAIAVLVLLFVLYRNKLQFSSWYKGKDRMKLSKAVSNSLIFSSMLLFILPFFLGSWLS
ncbi:hypothetical protein [Oceanobacillus rekensis]|uniref:hypothetical protein n=1 Tax=Oceanobacillus rekensis TaxID=937927 RepID=UPI000B42DCDC|nr:hypothetical protein [Oceanobacillus rekensis]